MTHKAASALGRYRMRCAVSARLRVRCRKRILHVVLCLIGVPSSHFAKWVHKYAIYLLK